MALTLKDRVKESTTSTGTGTVTLAGAATGYQSFSAVGNANTTYYCIAGQATSEWEVGIGTYTSAGTLLSRDTVLSSSNSGSLVSFSAGTKDVFVTYPSDKGLWSDASGNVGIGTASPTSKLSAEKAGDGNMFDLYDSTTGLGYRVNFNNASSPRQANFQINPGGTSYVTRMTLDGSGNVGIGVTPSGSRLHVYGASSIYAATFYSNTGASTTGLNNYGLAIGGNVSNGSAEVNMVYGSSGAGLWISSWDGTTRTERVAIDASGNVLVKSPAGLGYGTGAGGTVTQATSKSTAVTLNKPTGQITMNNAALGAGTSVQFTVNNSLISAYDMVLVSVNWSSDYEVRAVSTSAGSTEIVLKNTSGGSLSNAVLLNFAIIKGATS